MPSIAFAMRQERIAGAEMLEAASGRCSAVFWSAHDGNGPCLFFKNALLVNHGDSFATSSYDISSEMLQVGLSCARESPSDQLYIGTERGLYRVHHGAAPGISELCS
jgi:hypothetical protein